MELYDRGQDKAYRQLFAEFAGNGGAGEEECGGEVCDIGIIGATPLDTPAKDSPEHLRALCGGRAVCYGAGDGIRDVMNAHGCEASVHFLRIRDRRRLSGGQARDDHGINGCSCIRSRSAYGFRRHQGRGEGPGGWSIYNNDGSR